MERGGRDSSAKGEGPSLELGSETEEGGKEADPYWR